MPNSAPLYQFLRNEAEFANDIFLRQPFNGVYKTWTWKEAGDECRRMAAALITLNLPERSHIAILSKNCAHWMMADIAIMMAGCVSVPIYPTLTAASIQPILEHSDAKAIFIGKLDDFASQEAAIHPNLTRISFDDYGRKDQHNWSELIAQSQPLTNVYNWTADEILTIIYTSGTTGKPKGVVHTAGNFDIVLKAAIRELRLPERSWLFSYLPLSHIAERIGIEMNGIYNASVISFAESIDSFAKNVAEVQPQIFFAVPRLWGKFREGVLKKLPQKKLDILLSIPIINGIIKKSIKKKLGLSRATHIYSASAPIAVELLKWFAKLDIKIIQALGMTEDCVYAHFERPYEFRHGSVGKPFARLKVKITEEGELRVKSDANTKGYYKEPELTAELFDEDGYLKTGDICEYDHDGFLFVTGRIKDQFKTDKGKYISPAPIEMKILANPDIEQTCVAGMGIPQPIALVTLSDIGKQKTKEELDQSLTDLLQEVNQSLEHHELLAKVVIMKENWTIENGLLTPTMKVKRNQVEKIHQQFYPQWFNEKGTVIRE
ncbi:MAG: AMP-binding protein [Chitinophagaceae bacterium]|nr:AMP-binding protein [Chitinophagaceae bacterium]